MLPWFFQALLEDVSFGGGARIMIVAYFDFKICFVWCSPKMWLPGLRNVRCVGVWTLKFVYASLVSFFRRTSGMCLLGAVTGDDCVFWL